MLLEIGITMQDFSGEKYLATNSRAAQANASEAGFDFMNGHIDSDWGGTNAHSWMWKRARGYFDIVTWNIDGTGLQTINHNLGVAPEMIWSKIEMIMEAVLVIGGLVIQD